MSAHDPIEEVITQFEQQGGSQELAKKLRMVHTLTKDFVLTLASPTRYPPEHYAMMSQELAGTLIEAVDETMAMVNTTDPPLSRADVLFLREGFLKEAEQRAVRLKELKLAELES